LFSGDFFLSFFVSLAATLRDKKAVLSQGNRAMPSCPQTLLFDVSFPVKLLKIVATRGEIF